MTDRDGPAREQSERAVLAAALHGGDDGRAAERLRPVLPLDAFLLPSHLTIWQSVCDLVDNGRPVDSASLTDELRAQLKLDEVGGPAYLDSLLDALPYQLDLDGHVSLLLEAMRGRRWLAVQRRAAVALLEGAPLVEVRRLDDAAGKELLAPEQAQGRGEALAAVSEGVSLEPIRVRLCGRGAEEGRQTDLGWLIGGLYPGQIALVAGPTNVGKTAVMLTISLALAQSGVPVGIIPLEETAEELELRLGAGLSWVDIWRIQTRRYADPTQPARVAAAVAQLRALPLWIQWCPGATQRDVGAAIRDLVHRHGVRAVVVDYVQAISGGRDEYEAIRASLGEIERAMGRDCACFLGSQVNREGTKSGDPEIHHMRGAGTLEERARKVLVVSKASKEENQQTDTGRIQVVRREVKVAVKKGKGPEGECFGFVHRTKGLFWPGFAPPPWVTWVDGAEPRQRGLAAVPAEPGDELPRDGGAF